MGPANHRPAPRGQSYHRSRSSLKRPCQIRSGWRAEQSARGCRSWLEKRPGLVLVDRTMKGVVDARGRRVRALVRSDRGRLGHCRRRSRDGRESAPSCHAHRRSGGSARVNRRQRDLGCDPPCDRLRHHPDARWPGCDLPLDPRGNRRRPCPVRSVCRGRRCHRRLGARHTIAARQVAQEWAAAPADQKATALSLVHANETINFALASLFNFVFAAVTFILFGLAVALSDVFPRWLGWAVFLAGLASIGAGLIQAFVGEPTDASRILTIIGPTVITLWLLVIGILLLRKGSPLAPSRNPPSEVSG